MRPNITEMVVDQDKCIGCGICDSICPVDVLSMAFNQQGLYQPFESDGCLDKCRLCIDVCPFVEDNPNEHDLATKLYADIPNIQYQNDMGYFVKTYVAYKIDEHERVQSSSGGAGNWFLKRLIETNNVDKVLTVEANNDSNKLFKFSVFTNKDELDRSRGSVYYPTEISEVLDFVLENDGRYAITALPCYAKAIRLAQIKNHKLRNRIKFVIGLVCGQMKSKYYTEELGKIALGETKLSNVTYRVKKSDSPATDYSYSFVDNNGESNALAWSSYPSKFWLSRMFTPNACNFCTDVFALNADIVLMDAWLPEYTEDYRGHTLLITRTLEADSLIVNDKSIVFEEIDSKKVFESQKYVAINKNNVVYGSEDYLVNKIINYKKLIQKLSNEDYKKNFYKINKYLKIINYIEKIRVLKTIPARLVKKVISIVRGK